MLKTKNLLQLATLAVLLVAVLLVVTVSLPTSVRPVAVPTLMELPTENTAGLVQVAAVSAQSTLVMPATENTATPESPLPTAAPDVATAQPNTSSVVTSTEVPFTTALDAIPQVLPPDSTVPDQVVITFNAATSVQEREAYVAALGGNIQQTIDALNTVVVTLPEQSSFAPLPNPDIVVVNEPDYFVSAQVDVPPSDPFYDQQWALPVIGAPEAWLSLPANAPQVLVAVIDSGICADHPDLQGRILPGWDYVEQDAQPQDTFGHGCAIANIIAANADNGIGIAGAAPNALILPLRVLNAQGIGTYSDVAAAIVHATDNGAQVINLSLGGANASSVLEQAVAYAVERGVVVVAAAGNTGGTQVLYPAAYEPVIAVGSVDQNLEVSSFSNGGATADLLAPGRNIVSAKLDGSYGTMSGTSFAAAQVAAVAVLEISHGRTLTSSSGIVHFGGAAPASPAPASPTATLGSGGLNLDAPPSRESKVDSNLSSDLSALAAAWTENSAQALALGETFGLEITDNRVAVTVTMIDTATASAAKTHILALGGEVTAEYEQWFDALVPIASLTEVASLPGVALVQPIARVFPVDAALEEEPTNNDVGALAGSYTTQGVSASNANNWHAAGVTGVGVTVAVMDAGFSNYSTLQTNGELPPSPRLTTLGTIYSSAHGSAVAEIVYDMAPGINMILVSPGSGTEMAQRIQQLANYPVGTRPKVITSSIGYYNLESGDGSGPVSNAIAYALSQGVLFTQAAGNQAQYNWQGSFSDADADGWMDFAAGVEINQLGYLPAGYGIDLYMRWNGWPTTNQDYDFYVTRYNSATSTWDFVASSEIPQTGTQPPTESIYYVTSQLAYYGIAISRYSATGTQIIDLMGHNAPTFEYRMAERSLIDPGTSTSAFAVAALNTTSPFTLESYSSRGPALGSGGSLATGNSQPRISGFANVDTATTGYGGFNGTSSATPHVAGAAALVWQANPSYTVAQVKSFLEGRVVDMGTTGYDYIYGSGRLNLGTPPTLQLTNGNFSNGTSGWTFSSTTQNVTGGVLRFAPLSGSGGLMQSVAYAAVPNQSYELLLDMGNYTNAKTVNVMVRSQDWSSNFNCVYVVPWLPNGAMQSYTLRFVTPSTFTPMVVQIWASGDSSMALTLDNVVLRASATSVTSTQCSVAPPTNVNLVQGGDFSAGLGSWAAFNAQMQTVTPAGNPMMELARDASSTYGGFYQYMPFSAAANDKLEFTFQLGNNSSTNRVINMLLRDGDWLDTRSCFLNLPAFSPVTTYTMRVRTSIAWQNIVLQGWVQVGTYPTDPVYPFRFDNLELRSLPSLSVTSTDCPIVSSSLPAEALAVTAEATAELTPEATVEATAELTAELTAEATVEATVEATEAPVELPTAQTFPTLEPLASPTPLPTTQTFPTLEPLASPTPLPTHSPLPLPASATMDDGVADWQASWGWTLTPQSASGGQGYGWQVASVNALEILRWTQALDLRGLPPGQMIHLTFHSLLFSQHSTAAVQISLDGNTWSTVGSLAASADWAAQTVDLSAYNGQVVQIQFVWQGGTPAEGYSADFWFVDQVLVAAVPAALPTPLPTESIPVVPTLMATETPTTLPTATVEVSMPPTPLPEVTAEATESP